MALACITLAYAPESINDYLAFDRQAIFSGEIWRLWSAHLVHFSAQHALVDTAVFFLLGALVEQEIGTRRLGIGLALGAPFISLGLLLATPDLLYYRGASGLAMMVAILAGTSLWTKTASHRMVLALLAFGLVIKTACEAFGISADLSRLPQNAVVAWQAHVLGAGAGWLIALTSVRPCSMARYK